LKFTALLFALAFLNAMQHCLANARFKMLNGNILATFCANLMKIGAEKGDKFQFLGIIGKNRHISPNILDLY